MPETENNPYTNAFALLIGVGEDLPVSVRDAEALRDVLTDPTIVGYAPERVVCLTNDKASKSEVTRQLNKLARAAHKDPGTLIFIYYSGHGAKYDAEDRLEYYFLLNGWDEYDKKGTMLSAQEFSNRLLRINTSRMVVFLDCCHADGMEVESGVFAPLPAALKIKSPANVLNSFNGGAGRVFVTSCKENQKSWTLPSGRLSIFTDVLLGGLKGVNSSEFPDVNVIDIVHNLLRKVPAMAAETAGEEGPPRVQHPVISQIDDLDAAFIICKNTGTARSGKMDDPVPPLPVEYFGESFREPPQYIPRQEKLKEVKDTISSDALKLAHLKANKLIKKDSDVAVTKAALQAASKKKGIAPKGAAGLRKGMVLDPEKIKKRKPGK